MAFLVRGQIQALIWAQWRSLLNRRIRRRDGFTALAVMLSALWHAAWVFVAFGAFQVATDPDLQQLEPEIGVLLLMVFGLWQVLPVLTSSFGVFIHLEKIRVYPVSQNGFFGMQAALTLTAVPEALLILAGLAIGLVRNPQTPFYAPVPLLLFGVFNLFLSMGTREMLARQYRRTLIRHIALLVFALFSSVPQMLMRTKFFAPFKRTAESAVQAWFLPWTVAAKGAVTSPIFILGGALWMLLAFWFAWHQFQKDLSLSPAPASTPVRPHRRLLADIVPVIGSWFRDPLAALIEKELRTMGRSPRFRFSFSMGFSFGLLIWLPFTLWSGNSGALPDNYLNIVCSYALLLVSDVVFWNSFGMDRAAAQIWFAAPLQIRSVVLAKNCASSLFLLLEVTIIIFLCWLFRLPLSLLRIGEAYLVSGVVAVLLFSAGNLLAVRYPRPADPKQMTRGRSASSIQFSLFLVYPFVSLPILLAYGARYAFQSELAFLGVLAIDLATGLIVYRIALESSSETAYKRREEIISVLSQTESLVQT